LIFSVRIFLHFIFPIDKHNNIRVLLNRSGFT